MTEKYVTRKGDVVEFDELVHYKTNRFTDVVLVLKDQKVIARGISVCSPLDEYLPSVGKNKAEGRALKALVRKESTLPIRAHFEFDLPYGDRLLFAKEQIGKFKSEYLPSFISDQERAAVSRRPDPMKAPLRDPFMELFETIFSGYRPGLYR